MNRKELPNGVIDLLKDISEQVREYNLTAEYPLVAKPATDDYLLLIYPKGHEELFFKLDNFILLDLALLLLLRGLLLLFLDFVIFVFLFVFFLTDDGINI